MPYTAKHLESKVQHERPNVFLNPHWRNFTGDNQLHKDVERFHRTLPHYGETKLHSLPSVAAELGLLHVFIKDESTRFGLPSFKILGASWAIHCAICESLGLSPSLSLDELAVKLKTGHDVRLVTCTEGNWGRACARMAKYLSVPITVYVPGFMNEYTRGLIRSEDADVQVLENGSYDDAIAAVRQDGGQTGALVVLDTSWEGYTQFPKWVTEGYSTMLIEADRQIGAQTGGKFANLAFASVGVGSWAHSVVEHYRSKSADTKIVTVEPEAATSFKESLHRGEITPVETGETIMDGMNCGTTSYIAWPVLRDGVHAAVAVNDLESHRDVEYLQSQGVNAGPCGAATLAALREFCAEVDIPDQQDTVVVLFSTEGMREYKVPT